MLETLKTKPKQDARDSPVRFGGRGEAFLRPYPYLTKERERGGGLSAIAIILSKPSWLATCPQPSFIRGA